MTGLGDTLARLARLRRDMERLRRGGLAGAAGATAVAASLESGPRHLVEVQDFGPNPGKLRMLTYAPAVKPVKAPLVVLLHGCTQSATIYDWLSGWSELADRAGFILVCPEQRADNNPNLCFNWFVREHAQRDSGEAASISQMVDHAAHTHSIDGERIFIVGLSAGGAMANAVLAAYPDVFAGGAVIAGLPYGSVANVSDALRLMTKGRHQPARVWGQSVREASSHGGPRWPRLSIWHGDADTVVHPLNAESTLAQWVNVHAVSPTPDAIETLAGHRRRVWRNQDGEALVEAWSIAGLAHAVPLGINDGHRLGIVGPFHVETGLSSTARIAAFWGIAPPLPAPPAAQYAHDGALPAAIGEPFAGLREQLHTAGDDAARILRRMGLLKD